MLPYAFELINCVLDFGTMFMHFQFEKAFEVKSNDVIINLKTTHVRDVSLLLLLLWKERMFEAKVSTFSSWNEEK